MRIKTTAQAELLKSHTGNYPSVGDLVLKVHGAGYLAISQGKWSCGPVQGDGLDLCFSWTKHGYAGGPISRIAAIELRDFLTQWLDGTLEIITEEETHETDQPGRPGGQMESRSSDGPQHL